MCRFKVQLSNLTIGVEVVLLHIIWDIAMDLVPDFHLSSILALSNMAGIGDHLSRKSIYICIY